MALFAYASYLLQFWISLYLIIPVFFLLVYFIKWFTGTRFQVQRRKIVHNRDFDFAAIITAHMDTRFIPPLVDSLCQQNYRNFMVYVVADGCDTSSLCFYDPRVVVLKPPLNLNSKIKSIDYALAHFQRNHEVMVIFDTDNLVHPEFFNVMNQYFQRGYRAVQGNLQPKNTDSIFARLDTIGDVYYNFTEREMRMELGLSSSIWGLGIAVETELYKRVVYKSFLGGFDKRLQAELIKRIRHIAFAKEAIVYDEKITSGPALQQQRTRWLNSYFKNFTLNLRLFSEGVRNLDINQAFFGFYGLRPPLFITLGCSIIFLLVSWALNDPMQYFWMTVLPLFILSFLAVVSIRGRSYRLGRSIPYLPLFVFRQVSALFRMQRANRSFLKTEHTQILFIDELRK